MYNWPRFHSALLLNALAISVVVVLVLISCVCLLLEGVLRVCVCVCGCVCQIDKECALSPSLPPRSPVSEFGRGSPGAAVAVMASS